MTFESHGAHKSHSMTFESHAMTFESHGAQRSQSMTFESRGMTLKVTVHTKVMA